jgi:uncharacterized protein YdaU (DUF1376 family)
MSGNGKAPAYLWYPKDYLADANTVLMTLEQEGAYRRLLDYCWLEGSIPNDMEELGRLCKGLNPDKMRKVWKAIEPCFRKRGGKWVHPRLDVERKKQKANREAKSRAGKLGAEARHGKRYIGTAKNMPEADPSLTITNTATPTEKKKRKPKKATYSPLFEKVWSIHSKGPKKHAFSEYNRAIKNDLTTHDELLTALSLYVSEFQGGFTGMHLFRWIRDERWEEVESTPGLLKSNIVVGGKSLKT